MQNIWKALKQANQTRKQTNQKHNSHKEKWYQHRPQTVQVNQLNQIALSTILLLGFFLHTDCAPEYDAQIVLHAYICQLKRATLCYMLSTQSAAKSKGLLGAEHFSNLILMIGLLSLLKVDVYIYASHTAKRTIYVTICKTRVLSAQMSYVTVRDVYTALLLSAYSIFCLDYLRACWIERLCLACIFESSIL